MLAKEIMSKNLVTVKPDSMLREAAEQMSKHNIGTLPVYDGVRINGIITDRDLTIRGTANGIDYNTPEKNIMSNHCVTCSDEDSLESAVDLMEQKSVRRLVVTSSKENNKPIGIFSLDDIARKSRDKKLSGNAFMQLNKHSRKTVAVV